MFRLTCSAALTGIVTAAALLHSQADPRADLIVHNATIHTGNPRHPRAAAIAVRGDRLVAVGTNADALRLRGPDTHVIDAKGRTITPGLIDAHGHFTGLGASLQMLDFRGATSVERIVDQVRAQVAKSAPGEWILGRSWDQNLWATRAWPTHEALDRVTPDNPVYLTRVDGHAALVNARAMSLAGLTAETPDPDGGRLIRDAGGRPTGVLIDRAMGLVSSRVPRPTPRQLEEQILLADAETRRLGLTMVHDAGASAEVVDAYERLIAAGTLKTRLYVMLRMPLDQLQPFFDRGPVLDRARHRLVVRAIKISADGALGSRGAALLAPYSDEPSTSGLLLQPPEDVYAMTLAAARAGFQTCIHAIGDRANRLVLDVFERVQNEVPGARDLRLRNEHTQILDPADIPRLARLGVIASMQSTHATSDMAWVPARLGHERANAGAYVWRKLMRTGALIANGSDFPVEEPNPMLGFYAAITRQDPAGRPPGGWMPDERMTREEALASFTANAAFAAHAERDLGTLEPGKLADFVMLSHDIMQVAPADVLATTVIRTIVGGEIVFEAAREATSPAAR
jgi:predicted amidohydrolase YtcJ